MGQLATDKVFEVLAEVAVERRRYLAPGEMLKHDLTWSAWAHAFLRQNAPEGSAFSLVEARSIFPALGGQE